MGKWIEDLNMAIDAAKKLQEKSSIFLDAGLGDHSNRKRFYWSLCFGKWHSTYRMWTCVFCAFFLLSFAEGCCCCCGCSCFIPANGQIQMLRLIPFLQTTSCPTPYPPGSSDEVSVEQESEDDMNSSRTSLDKQTHHRANTTMHVCWHRNTSVSMSDHSLAVEVLLLCLP